LSMTILCGLWKLRKLQYLIFRYNKTAKDVSVKIVGQIQLRLTSGNCTPPYGG